MKRRKPRPFKSKHPYPVVARIEKTVISTDKNRYIAIFYGDSKINLSTGYRELKDFSTWLVKVCKYLKQKEKKVKR